jgi:nucleoid-associated protein YgaU
MAAAMTLRMPVPTAGRPTAATFWRRRFAAAVVTLAIVVPAVSLAAPAGRALGGSSLAAPERHPTAPDSLTRVVVEPGDTLWSIAEQLVDGGDPRPVVDALAEARGTTVVVPGETVVWPR